MIFASIIAFPLNAALTAIEERLSGIYSFTGSELAALQVINVCTTYVLVFVVFAVLLKTLIASKAENANEAY